MFFWSKGSLTEKRHIRMNLPKSRGGGGGTYGFGAITAARDPRIIQLAAKIYF